MIQIYSRIFAKGGPHALVLVRETVGNQMRLLVQIGDFNVRKRFRMMMSFSPLIAQILA